MVRVFFLESILVNLFSQNADSIVTGSFLDPDEPLPNATFYYDTLAVPRPTLKQLQTNSYVDEDAVEEQADDGDSESSTLVFASESDSGWTKSASSIDQATVFDD
jgi:hypothetical protein